MRKLVLSFLLLLCITGIAGCSKKDLIIDSDKVSVNTFIAKADGKLQVATVEKFDQSYYKLEEAEDFAKKEIDTYNKEAGGEKVKYDDIHLLENDTEAVMVLSYTGMDQYSTFNRVPAAYFTGGIKEYPLEIPESLINVKNTKSVNTNEVIQNSKYKVLVMYEPYQIVVDGKIMYYSEGAKLISSNKIQSVKDGATVVVFKP